MSKPANETPVKKSKSTKALEIFKDLNLVDQEEFLEMATEIHRVDLKKKEDDLTSQVIELQNKQEKLK